MSYPGTTVRDGRGDIDAAAAELAERLPEALAPLARLAYNYRWSWYPGGHELFAAVDHERFELCLRNPVRLLQEASRRALSRAAASQELVAQAVAVEAAVSADLERPADPRIDSDRPVAFFCAEYGVHVSLPVYSGGLGALAGDILKQASDQALPVVAVGLMYRKGYFRQRIDASGWQHEYWVDTDPQRLPAARVTTGDGAPLSVELPIYDTDVTAHVWRVNVGRVPLFLLDTDISQNPPIERWITARLYETDARTRLAQYVLLGVGGMRALAALGIDPSVIHLNEGHAALAPLALGNGARERTVFTTHTPVSAGNDSYPANDVSEAMAKLRAELSLVEGEVIKLGRTNPDDQDEPFGVTQAALRMSRAANGVSRRHGEVARAMWNPLWPELAVEQVPIGYVTNGVHVPTWIGSPMRQLLDRHLGEGWMSHAADPETWAPIDRVPAPELWGVRQRQRGWLIEFARRRSTQDRLLRGDLREYVEAAARVFDPDVLTIGFARRVATYKRLDLLTRDPEWTIALLSGERPVQVVLAGKAHPRDEEAKHSLQRLFGLKYAQVVGERVVYLDDYDLATAAVMVQGCDLWLNLPRPPLEASGTSGMKSAFNGGLQLSVLDGWWAEAFDGGNGWGLPGDALEDHAAQDDQVAHALHGTLDEQVVPAFYERDAEGVPEAWISLMRASLRTLAPRFCATRMVNEYVDRVYRAG
ncbi:MAG TPA: alpha-glucan family phosphorylase [Solirubrobacteraceae bacterium]|nr:alpha-glucan family phosphorylase [Solirubrobacteraceae bacterium]